MKMKKIALALAGASVAFTGLAATPASAQEYGRFDRNRHEQVQTRQFQGRQMVQNRFGNQRFQARNWRRGERFDSRYAMNYQMISNPGYYHLRPAPRGYRWVQSGNDAVLVAIAGGLIGAVLANAF
jgi:Ni/Co efflux regulator RcnB